MHQQQGRSALLTLGQEEWLKIQRMSADATLKVCVAGAAVSVACAHRACGALCGATAGAPACLQHART